MNRLTSPIFVASQVIKGFGRGSKELGIPTANLEEDVIQGITLDDGIYYGFAQLLHPPDSPLYESQRVLFNSSGKSKKYPVPDNVILLDTAHNIPIYPMVCSLGWNPQFNNKTRTLEVHILNKFEQDFYGSLIRVAICGYIRPENRFESVQVLIDTIHQDIEFARDALNQPEKSWAHVITDRFFYV